jgi:hypothetical protein
MAKSTNLIGDIDTAIAAAPTAATAAKAIAAAGPIMDYVGMTKQVKLRITEALGMLTLLDPVVHSGDTTPQNAITSLKDLINGTGTPNTQVLTDLATVIAAGVNSTSAALAIAAAGPIQDPIGMFYAIRQKFADIKSMCGQIKNATDSGDSSLTQIQQIIDVLV